MHPQPIPAATATPNTDAILTALAAAGLPVTGQQIEADSIDIHIGGQLVSDHAATALSWRPDGHGWYLLPIESIEGDGHASPEYLADGTPEQIAGWLTELLDYTPATSPTTIGDVGKCPRCGKQSRSHSRGCSECGHGQPAYRVAFDVMAGIEPMTFLPGTTTEQITTRLRSAFLAADVIRDGQQLAAAIDVAAGTVVVSVDGDVIEHGSITAIEPAAPAPDHWLTLAEDLHRAAVRIATLAGTGRKPTYVSLNIQLASPGNTDPTVSADIDAVAAAFGVEAKSAKSAGGYYEHGGRTNLGDLNINPYGYVPAPEDPEKAALAARVAELEAKLAEGGA